MYFFSKKSYHLFNKLLLTVGLVVLVFSCSLPEKKMFNSLPSSSTGITFTNTITETDSLSILNFHYIYNGGGVGIGDFDNNGLPDLVFTGNQVASKLYLNSGGLKFEDITTEANFVTNGWNTGVSVVDINGDGWSDIYISTGGFKCDNSCANKLFINQGLNKNNRPFFKEQADAFGLADALYTQQAAFFDYDKDGDLDVYLLHNVIDQRDKNAPSHKGLINKKSIDQLLRNDGMDNSKNMIFTNVSEQEGIIFKGYGLGITINDFNKDGWPDIYIANDFLSDDLIYLNINKDGVHSGFKEIGQQKLKHTSYNSMGVDIADINNDALPDIFVLDMLPEYHERQKISTGFMNYNKFLFSLKQGYAPQFVRNTLQIHNGFINEELLAFSEVGYLSGLYKTDWSWTPLLADFDNDGDRDIYVTNGYGKDITDLDFISYNNQSADFGTPKSKQKKLFESVQKMSSITLPNYFFENNGNLQFEDQSDKWIKTKSSISNGAAYADLDNDGDLDIIVNNINETAYVLENTSPKNEKNNYLRINLKGPANNGAGIGTAIYLWKNGKAQYYFQSPVRGYLSTVESIVHFGLGETKNIDSIQVVWPNGLVEVLKNVPANQTMDVRIADAKEKNLNQYPVTPPPVFKAAQNINSIRHSENAFQDFDAQPLLLHQHSRQGPCLATANVDGNPGDEIFIGGAKGFSSRILFPQKQGNHKVYNFPDSLSEDTDAAFFDVDQDGDLDLYVVSGGVEFADDAIEWKDRLYLNDGKGNFEKDHSRLPDLKFSGSCVVPADYDQDGDIDLFVGSRIIPRKYPMTPQSQLLTNHNGKFIANTDKFANGLKNIGMVTGATWSDFDQDGKLDLIVVGEWMPITIFKNAGGGYFEKAQTIKNSNGLWNTITSADIDNDGDDDYLLGNLGRNTRLQASVLEPVTIYKNDFDDNGSPDPLVSNFYENKKGERKSYPVHARDDVMKQLSKLKGRYVKYADFGNATFPELLNTKTANTADQLFANELNSVYLKNNGNGDFEMNVLPRAAQYAPVQAILVEDFDGDGHKDALLSGNDYTAEKNGGWHDAFNGLFLKGNGKGDFIAVPASESNFFVPGDGRDIVKVQKEDGTNIIMVGQNDGEVKMFKVKLKQPSDGPPL